MAKTKAKITLREELKIKDKTLYKVKTPFRSTINRAVFVQKAGDTVMLTPFEHTILAIYLEESE